MHIRNNPDMTQQRNVPRKSQSTKQVDPSITCRIKGSPAQSKTTSTATMNPCSFHIAANQRRRACSPDPDYTRIRGDAHCTSQHATPPKLLEKNYEKRSIGYTYALWLYIGEANLGLVWVGYAGTVLESKVCEQW
ncbi:hypothetical protein AAZV13_13G264450 [Glycine max]